MKKRPVPLPPEQLPEKPMDLSSMVPPTSMSSGIVIQGWTLAPLVPPSFGTFNKSVNSKKVSISKEILYILVAQEATNLEAVKYESLKKL